MRTAYDRAMDERLERYAELVVRIGANVQPGQEVFLSSALEHHELTRALARQSYRVGASYVHVLYNDAHVRRAMIELGPYLSRLCETLAASMIGDRRPICCKYISATGPPLPPRLSASVSL